MSWQNSNEGLLEVFIFETTQLLEQLEQMIIACDNIGVLKTEDINEIFRIMHTIKGSSAMMQFQEISILAHSIEDVFFFLRDNSSKIIGDSRLSDLLLNSIDFIKFELVKIINEMDADGNPCELIQALNKYLMQLKGDEECINSFEKEDEEILRKQQSLKLCGDSEPKEKEVRDNCFEAVIYFEEDCGMEHIRAYTVLNEIKDIVNSIRYVPENLEIEEAAEVIKKNGFVMNLTTKMEFEYLHQLLTGTVFLKEMELRQITEEVPDKNSSQANEPAENMKSLAVTENVQPVKTNDKERHDITKSMISVSVTKLDKLMDLMGEMVITQSMVLQNPDLQGLPLNNFQKAARQLNKITSELQDTVMAIRMVPLSATFHKMRRIVRDMSRKLDKEVSLIIEGEDTEVDKNIIEHISDPLMHLVRNALDHGIENPIEREKKGKTPDGSIVLKAENSGSNVMITIKDDGKGLNKDNILTKAKQCKLLYKPAEELTEKEIYNLIFLPGFSTKEEVTEFSGRGVGMDVVMKNIETVGGSLVVDSNIDRGTTITLKIPLTLAIIDGMNLSVGQSNYTLPTLCIKESFRPNDEDIIIDPDGNEMIMLRKMVYPVIRLHKVFHVKPKAVHFSEGIIIMVTQDEKTFCLFADCLIGQQQVVVKALPDYVRKVGKLKGIGGCTLLGDGSISLILDIADLI